MWAIAIPASADTKAVRSMEAKVGAMGLGRPDMNVLRAELAGFHARFQVPAVKCDRELSSRGMGRQHLQRHSTHRPRHYASEPEARPIDIGRLSRCAPKGAVAVRT
jgi:hypothetical protein